jgi:drug/metabolite transporter (DMT)-like permease
VPASQQAHRSTTPATLLLVFIAAVWGSTFVLVKDALRDISPLLFNLLRMVIATGALALLYHRELPRLRRSYLRGGLLVGLCLAAGYSFQTAGLARTTPAKSAFITGMIVVLVPLLCAVPRLRPATMRAPNLAAFAGAVLAFAGILLLTTPSGTAWSVLFRSINSGDVLTLFCALGFALHVLALAHVSRDMPLGALALLQMAACTLMMALALPVFEHPHLQLSGRLLVALLIAGVLATAVAFTVQSWAQQQLSATRTALILALEPVFAFLTSYLFFGERLSTRATAGALLIMGGIAVTELLPQVPHGTAHEAPVA